MRSAAAAAATAAAARLCAVDGLLARQQPTPYTSPSHGCNPTCSPLGPHWHQNCRVNVVLQAWLAACPSVGHQAGVWRMCIYQWHVWNVPAKCTVLPLVRSRHLAGLSHTALLYWPLKPWPSSPCKHQRQYAAHLPQSNAFPAAPATQHISDGSRPGLSGLHSTAQHSTARQSRVAMDQLWS